MSLNEANRKSVPGLRLLEGEKLSVNSRASMAGISSNVSLSKGTIQMLVGGHKRACSIVPNPLRPLLELAC